MPVLDSFGEDHLITAECQMFLGIFHISEMKIDLAIQYFFKSLKAKKKILGEYSWDLALLNNLIAWCYTIKQDYQSALKYHQNALNINLKFYGRDHRDTAFAFKHVAEIYFLMKNYPEAVANVRKAVEIATGVLGKEHNITQTFQKTLQQYEKTASGTK